MAAYTGLFNPPATVVQWVVRLTEEGALPTEHGIQFDIEIE